MRRKGLCSMRYLGAFAAFGLMLAVAGTAGAVTFVFDAEDFFDYRQTDGFNVDGGMTKLHKKWATDPMYRSWEADQRPTLNDWAASLGEGEGICRFNMWLADSANAPAWGETLVSSGSYMPSGTAPAGWTATVGGNPWPAGDDGYWLVEWSTDDPSKYIRPGNSVGDFSFTFLPTTPVTLGDYYTIWFGGANYGEGTDAEAALVFDDTWSGGFGSQFVPAYGTGFEATLKLQAVPEPITMAGLVMGIGALGGYIRRRR